MSEKVHGDWAFVTLDGKLHEAQAGILDVLGRYKGETAKIYESKDTSDKDVCYVIVKIK